jgi:DNA-binding IclR family transcriptional regulator
MNLFKGLIDDKVLKVLKIFTKEPDQFFHINKVAEASSVPLATTFRIINSLVQNKLLTIQKISKFKIYSLAKNKKTKKLRRLL